MGMGKNTKTLLGANARKTILAGVNKVYEPVAKTFGPKGKNALIPRTMNRGPRNTNDGVSVSENVILKNPHEKLVADFFKEGAMKNKWLVGDGTTTTTIIGGHLVNAILKKLPDNDTPELGKSKSDDDVMAMRKEIKESKEKVIAEIEKRKKEVKTLEDLKKIAFISIEDKKLADIVADMVWKLGVDNYVDTVEGFKGEIETEITKGMRFPARAGAKEFLNRLDIFSMVAEECPILLTNYKLDNPNTVATVINNNLQIKSKIVIMAPDFTDSVLIMFHKAIKNGLFIYPVKVPSLRTDQFDDLAIYTGARFINKDTGGKLENITTLDLGFADKLIVKDTDNRDDAVLIGGQGEKVKRGKGNQITERCEMLKKQMKEAKNNLTRESLKRRIANMASAVGVIRVGASTDAEILYLKLKIENGVNSCKASLKGGYVKGGGLCLKEIADELPKSILTETLKEPYNIIAKNIRKIGNNVIDPAEVVKLSVEHGVSIAQQLITTDIIIAEETEMTDAEGNLNIAKALGQLTYFWAKERGMIKVSEEEAEKDMAKAFAESMCNDID